MSPQSSRRRKRFETPRKSDSSLGGGGSGGHARRLWRRRGGGGALAPTGRWGYELAPKDRGRAHIQPARVLGQLSELRIDVRNPAWRQVGRSARRQRRGQGQ